MRSPADILRNKRPKLKYCGACGKDKLLSEFQRYDPNKGNIYGRLHEFCSSCEGWFEKWGTNENRRETQFEDNFIYDAY